MADEKDNVIRNQIIFSGLDEAGRKIATLRQQLKEIRDTRDRAFQSEDKQATFKGTIQSLQELSKLETETYRKLQEAEAGLTKAIDARQAALDKARATQSKAANTQYWKDEEAAIRKNTELLKEQWTQRVKLEDAAKAEQARLSDLKGKQNQSANTQYWKDEEAAIRKNTALLKAQWEARVAQEDSLEKERLRQTTGNPRQEATELARAERLNQAWRKSDASAAFSQYTNLSAQLREANTEAERLYMSMMRASTATEKASATTAFRAQRTEVANLNKAMQGFNDSMRVASARTGLLDSFMQKLHSHMNWIIAGSIISAAVAAPIAVADTLTKLETGMAGVEQVMDKTAYSAEAAKRGISEMAVAQQHLNEEEQKLIGIASTYGESVDKVIQSGQLWGRTYKDVNTVNALVSQSTKLAVADNFDMVEANKAVEAAMFQYGLTAKNATEALAYSGRIIDVWTKLAHNAGASAQDIAKGVEQAGSAAHLAGVDFEFLSAQIATGVRATGKSGNEIGTMLKSLYSSIYSDKAVKELDKIGVSAYKIGADGSKQIRKAQDVILDLALTANETDKSLQKMYESISGGKWQYSKAAATLGDYKEFIRTWGLSVNSVGFTDQQVMMQIDTLQRRIATLKADLTSLISGVGNNGLTKFLKDNIRDLDNFVIALNHVPSGIFSTIGSLTKLALTMGVVNTAIKMFRTTEFAKSFEAAEVSIKGATTAVRAFGVASSTAIKANLPLLVITATVYAIESLVDSMGEEEQKQRELNATKEDSIAVANQQIKQYQQQEEFSDKMFEAYGKLTEVINTSTEGSDKYNKAVANRQATEEQLTAVLGQAAVERIAQAGWTQEAYDKERQNFEDNIAAKRKALAVMRSELVKSLEKQRDVIMTQIAQYKKDAESFNTSILKKIQALGIWQTALSEYYQFRAKFERFEQNAALKEADEINNNAEYLHDKGILPDSIYNSWKQRANEQIDIANDHAKNANDAEQSGQNIIAGHEAELEKNLAEIEQKIVANSVPDIDFNGSTANGGSDVDDSGKKGRKGAAYAPLDTSDTMQAKEDMVQYNIALSENKRAKDEAAASTARLDAQEALYGVTQDSVLKRQQVMNTEINNLEGTLTKLMGLRTQYLNNINSMASADGAQLIQAGTGDIDDGTPEGHAMAFFINKGYTLEQAAGIVANLQAEDASLDPTVHEGHTGGDLWDEGGYGIVQWTDPGRKRGLSDYANSTGGAYNDYETQLGFTDYELRNDYTTAFNNLGNATTPEEAAYIIARDYEKPAWAANPVRQSNARDLYDKYSNMSVSVPYVQGLSDVVNQQDWSSLDLQGKLQVVQDHKEQVHGANGLIAELQAAIKVQNSIYDKQKELAQLQKAAIEQQYKSIEALVNQVKTNAEDLETQKLYNAGINVTQPQKDYYALQADDTYLATWKDQLDKVQDKSTQKYRDELAKYEKAAMERDELQKVTIPDNEYKERQEQINSSKAISEANMPRTPSIVAESKQSQREIEYAEQQVDALKQKLKELNDNGVTGKVFRETQVALAQALKSLDELKHAYDDKLKQSEYDLANDLLLKGNKLRDIWKNLWHGLAEDALKALLGIKNNNYGFLAQILGVGKASGSSLGGAAIGAANIMGALQKQGGGGGMQAPASAPAFGVSSILSLFHATGGIENRPAIFGEDGEEVAIPTEKHTGNSVALLNYAAQKLGLGTKVDAQVSAKTQQTAQSVLEDRQHLDKLDTMIDLTVKQNATLMSILTQSQGNSDSGGTLAPVVVSQAMTNQQFSDMFAKARALRLI